MSEREPFEAPPGWPLTVDMQQRAEGLKIARTIVKSQTPFGGASIHTEVGDLIRIAEYIVDGPQNNRPLQLVDSGDTEEQQEATP